MKQHFSAENIDTSLKMREHVQITNSTLAGYFQWFNKKQLVNISCKENIIIHFLHPVGTFVLEGSLLFSITGKYIDDEKIIASLLNNIDFFNGQPIDLQPEYGFRHLTEVAIRALSPGINDPATAIFGLNAVTEFFAFRFLNYPVISFVDEQQTQRTFITVLSAEELWSTCIDQVWHYGKNDVSIQRSLSHSLHLLINLPLSAPYQILLKKQQNIINS